MKLINTVIKKGSHGFKIMLSSGDGEENAGCALWLEFRGRGIIFNLPPIFSPYREKVVAGWDAATVARLGRDWYWRYEERSFGTYLFDNHFNICYGREGENGKNDTEKRWSCLLPWNEWRHVRHSLYGVCGEHFYSQFDDPRGFIMLGNFEISEKGPGCNSYAQFRRWEEKCPKVWFHFKDFDGELIWATTHIEEREWHRGVKWFKFLSAFCTPMIRRSLDIKFSAEVGPRKGSWKGGTVGHSIDMERGELHELAFRRYCEKHNLTFMESTIAEPSI